MVAESVAVAVWDVAGASVAVAEWDAEDVSADQPSLLSRVVPLFQRRHPIARADLNHSSGSGAFARIARVRLHRSTKGARPGLHPRSARADRIQFASDCQA